MRHPWPFSLAAASPLQGRHSALRWALILLGLTLPLNLPFSLPTTHAERVLGWTARPVTGGGMLVTRTHWVANAAGLLPGDVVRTANGAEATPANVERIRAIAGPGEQVSLMVQRMGRTLHLVVPVVDDAAGYSAYLWYRFVLALVAWLVGMGLIVWRGDRPPALALGAALLLVPAVTLPVEVQGHGVVLGVANTVWQLEAGAYRLFVPVLLLHTLVLQTGRPAALKGRGFWVLVYLVPVLALFAMTHYLSQPLAWRTPGTEQTIRHGAGLALELLALAGVVAVMRNAASLRRPVQWLVFCVLLFLLSGIPITAAGVIPGAAPGLLEFLRQIKSITLLLLIATAALYLLSLAQDDGEEWQYRRSLAASASMVLTGLYGFAVAGAAAIVHSLETRAGELEGLLFATIFFVAILFSPVLGWAREIIDRRLFARWSELEMRAHAFVNRIGAALRPERIVNAVSRELPFMLDVRWARLVLSRELADTWGVTDELDRDCASNATLAEQTSAGRTGEEVVVPVRRTDGEIVGALYVGPRLDGRDLEAPDHAVLRTLSQGVAAAFRISETYFKLRRAEQELHEAEAITSLATLASGLAHEIKNPLASLKMGLYLMERNGKSGDMMTRIHHDVRRVDDLVTGLLRYTTAEAPEPPQAVDMTRQVTQCVEDLRPLADDQGVAIVEHYCPGPCYALGTAERVRLIVSNVLTNALHAAGENGIVEVHVRGNGNSIHLTVDDTGLGVAPEDRAGLFQLNFTTKRSGNGLGLAIARRETERMGGRIEFVEPADSGTRLQVILPRISLP